MINAIPYYFPGLELSTMVHSDSSPSQKTVQLLGASGYASMGCGTPGHDQMGAEINEVLLLVVVVFNSVSTIILLLLVLLLLLLLFMVL